ncbi:TonB-dependent receptor [Aquisediminimonas profunda]|uniref:TonB-dependent receptor n=1 Tax=Aquisediminimonas profunda TaxID=1550733 RepID=UPI001C632914|nr:TonB-dependent receptor [Aquisediminimonas profunda]
MSRRVALLCVSALLISAQAALAQEAPDQSHGDHDEDSGEIVVTALLGRNQADLLAGTSVVSGEDLARELKPTIGETLSHQPGVSATSFGPNASRPVLRGFQGERVRVLADGIGSFDVSNTSVDHAVVINPLTADRIEVLRGPSALLFGSSAIGGVVNVVDSRIPRKVPDEAVHVDALATYGSAANERSGGARVDVPVADKFVLHLDSSYVKTGDLEIGGHVLTPALRAQAASSADPAIVALADLKDRLPNSAGRTWEIAGGAAYITSDVNLGFSVSRYDSLYGVPIRYSLDPAVTAESVRLDVKQTRFDTRAEYNPTSGFLEGIRFRGGYADYRHNELAEDGTINTTFNNTGGEARLELVQRERNGWKGAIGSQYVLRKVNIIGAEKFLPAIKTQQYGLFTVQSLDLGAIRAEAGGRIEHSVVSARADAILGNPDSRRSFTSYSGSLGASAEFAHGWRLGLNSSYTERAPAGEELFANGPHAGTQAFEIGNPGFAKEKSKGLEATLHGSGDGYSLSASLYYSWFKGFIYETPTGVIQDGLPVFQSRQAGAHHYGAEIEASVRVATIGAVKLNIDGVGDFTRATIRGGGPLPRIPALRLLGGFEAQSDRITGRVEVEWVGGQDRIAAFETPTKGYTMVNGSLAIKPFGTDSGIDVTLSANNIFDVVARRHASFLKDYAPLSGRDIRIGLRFAF